MVFLAALTLPRTGRTVEARLQTEMNFALADRGLTDIEAHMDGQTVTLAYRPAEVADSARTSHHMALAITATQSLTGGLYDEYGRYGPIWGPVTCTRVAQSSPATNNSRP